MANRLLSPAWQREGRQREAAGHYQVAPRTGARNGVWWMGRGISLQAEKHDAEAVAAFQQALASGAPAAALQACVEGRLRQFGRRANVPSTCQNCLTISSGDPKVISL